MSEHSTDGTAKNQVHEKKSSDRKYWVTSQFIEELCEHKLTGAHLVQREPLFLQQGDLDVIVDTLEKQFRFVGNQVFLLGCLQGANQSLKDVGTTVVVEQDPKRNSGLTISVYDREQP